MSIYADIILDHYQYPRNNKKLQNPTHTIDVANSLCGDKLHLEMVVAEGIIRDVGFTAEGCAISIASASMLTEHVLGKPVEILNTLSKEDVLGLLGITLTPNRMKCALLSWEALVKVKHT